MHKKPTLNEILLKVPQIKGEFNSIERILETFAQ